MSPSITPCCCLRILLCYLLPGCVTSTHSLNSGIVTLIAHLSRLWGTFWTTTFQILAKSLNPRLSDLKPHTTTTATLLLLPKLIGLSMHWCLIKYYCVVKLIIRHISFALHLLAHYQIHYALLVSPQVGGLPMLYFVRHHQIKLPRTDSRYQLVECHSILCLDCTEDGGSKHGSK